METPQINGKPVSNCIPMAIPKYFGQVCCGNGNFGQYP